MIIEVRKTKCHTKLSDIKKGECFRYGDKYYIRSDEIWSSGIQIIDPEDGSIYNFDMDILVYPVKAKLVIISEG